jgi:hypothetical protein
MKTIMLVFDYIFYRAYKFYSNRTDTPEIYGAGIVFIIQGGLLFSVYVIVTYFVDTPIESREYFIPFVFALLALNWRRYVGTTRVEYCNSVWKGESKETRLVRGWLIVFGFALSLAFPALIGKLIFELQHQ